MRPNHWLLYLILALSTVALYTGLSAIGGQTGFPLDDAWIHQTYARNLAASGQMAYVPGQTSAGSTSPLWTLLLAAGYGLKVDYRLWTYLLGGLALALVAIYIARLSLRLWPDRTRLALAAGLLCALEWRLAWAAASGMETLLFAALALVLIDWTARHNRRPSADLVFGVLGGLLTVTRPEGLLLVGLAVIARYAQSQLSVPHSSFHTPSPKRERSGILHLVPEARAERDSAFFFILGFLVPITPAIWLNLQASGAVFPNTFYAKQQEYVVYFSSLAVWLPRALDVFGSPLIGAQVLLLPGFALQVVAALRRLRDRSSWTRALPLVWLFAHLLVYAVRLPVTYQHGRYLIPLIPIIVLFGLHGSADLIERVGWGRFVRRTAIASLAAAALAFWIVGALAYRVDVNIIENELVASARWIDAHTPPDALIAAHDIGAIGYFARRQLLDLAGLISPEVIPIIRDEAALLELMRSRGADYFAAPPGFYASLTHAPVWQIVFEGDSPFAPSHWLVFRATWD
jgi:hypothetical protein